MACLFVCLVKEICMACFKPYCKQHRRFLQLILDLWGWRCWTQSFFHGCPSCVYLWTSSPLGVGWGCCGLVRIMGKRSLPFSSKCLFPHTQNPWNPAGSLTMRTIPKKTEERNRDCFSKKNRQPEKIWEQVVFSTDTLILTGSDQIRSQYSRNDPFS